MSFGRREFLVKAHYYILQSMLFNFALWNLTLCNLEAYNFYYSLWFLCWPLEYGWRLEKILWSQRISCQSALRTIISYMPISSPSSKNIFTAFKFFWACSIFFKHSQIFWSWSKARFYFINLHISAWSKIFEHGQKYLTTVKNIWTGSKNIWTSRWIRH